MASIRPAELRDVFDIRDCNQNCLPENYETNSYLLPFMQAGSLQFVAEAEGKIVGYILVSLDGADAHVTSLAVLRGFRKLGIAARLLEVAHQAAVSCCRAECTSLEVRPSNSAAVHLYESRGFARERTNYDYYADGENSWRMVCKKQAPDASSMKICTKAAPHSR